jgi:hypothetical protein
MGSVKLKDLKAFVRYDGSGRVVAGSLVFRKKKPKNGRWVEITKNECCDVSPSSTTTTTTQGGGGTPTAWVVSTGAYDDFQSTCNNVGGTQIIYTAESTLDGAVTYIDASLTTVNAYLWFAYDGFVYETNNRGVAFFVGTCPLQYHYTSNYYYNCNYDQPAIVRSTDPLTIDSWYTDVENSCINFIITGEASPSNLAYQVDPNSASPSCIGCPTTTTTTTAYVGQYYNADYNSGAACAGIGLFSLPLILGISPCTTGAITLAVGTYADYGITNGSNIYINLQDGNLIQVQVFGSSQMSFGCTSCG